MAEVSAPMTADSLQNALQAQRNSNWHHSIGLGAESSSPVKTTVTMPQLSTTGHTSSSHQRILMVQTNDESLTAKTHRPHTTMRPFTKLSPPHFSTRSLLQQLRYLGPPPTSASARKIHGVAMKWIGINVDYCIYLTLQKECIL
uniref:Uncharacterized protein n=1 Tax=Caenorhabditis japonica TaxID=281687 RepID=A0A8R1EDQ9_CAEJA